jgi:AcrR family transcriptional regulator
VTAVSHRAERTRGPRAGRRTTWRRDPGGRRQRILDAATRLFGSDGYREVTTATIAAAAGVAEGTLFHHFGSKNALLREVSSRYGSGFADAMFAGLPADSGMPDVDAVVARAFAYVRFTHPHFGVYLLANDSAAAPSARRANREAIVTRLADLFTGWSANGQIREVDPRILAELCFGLVETALRECYVGVEISDAREARYAKEVATCIRGMLARPA